MLDPGVQGTTGQLTSPTLAPRGRVAAIEPVLVFERVSKFYGPVIGVNQVTLELRPGITGLVGSNGAGKSTLMRLAAGQARPDLGRVQVRGHDARSAEARLRVGYCPEVDTFYEEMSGRQFVQTMARLCGYRRGEAHQRAEETLRQVGMTDRSDRRLRGYSKGMRQRIKLAQALLHDPPLLLLDEPLSGIDPVGRQEFIGLFLELAERNKCLLVSSHELEELEKLTDHVAIMARGRIAAVGSIAQIRERLEDQPLSIRIDIDWADVPGSRDTTRNGVFHVEHPDRLRRGPGGRSVGAQRRPPHRPGATAASVLPGADPTGPRGMVRGAPPGAAGRVDLGGPWLSARGCSCRGVTCRRDSQGEAEA
ncbi:MAG: ABC transporter ATP-binding protein [Planctomycetes bacterium]|nr:ABC transporter ATP-binding protein [Planctomycetota bacterium]